MRENADTYITKITSDRTGAVSYQVCIPYTNSAGIRDHYTKTFAAKTYGGSAREALKAARKDRDRQLTVVESNPAPKVSATVTVSSVYRQLPQIYSRSLRTWEEYESLYSKYIAASCGNVPVKKLRALDIQVSINSMATIATHAVIRKTASLWRMIIRGAIFMDYLTYDLMIKVEIPRSEKPARSRRIVDLSPEAYERTVWALLNGGHTKSADVMFNRQMIVYAMHTMYYTGIRPQECFMLAKTDFDFDAQLLTIRSSVGSTPTDRVARKATKTLDSERVIPLMAELIDLLTVWFRQQPSELVFADHDGNLMSTKKASQVVRWAAHRVGVKFNFYMLRHKLGTDLIVNQHTDPRTVMAIMGHNNVRQTIEYAVSNEQIMRQALEQRDIKKLVN